MKKIVISCLATTALLAAVAFGLLHYEYYMLLSADEVSRVDEGISTLYQAYSACKTGT